MKRLFKWAYLPLMIILLVTTAYADEPEIWIGYAPICKHFNGDPELNEQNHAVFLSYDKWIAGTFNNSGNIQSYFLGRTFQTDKWEYNHYFSRLNIHIGALYGYEEDMPNIGGWTLGAAPTFEVGYKQYSLETMVNPFADGGVVSFMLKYTW